MCDTIFDGWGRNFENDCLAIAEFEFSHGYKILAIAKFDFNHSLIILAIIEFEFCQSLIILAIAEIEHSYFRYWETNLQ